MTDTKQSPIPPERCDDAEIMRIWRGCGLPEFFLGNDGSNFKLVEFSQSIVSASLIGIKAANRELREDRDFHACNAVELFRQKEELQARIAELEERLARSPESGLTAARPASTDDRVGTEGEPIPERWREHYGFLGEAYDNCLDVDEGRKLIEELGTAEAKITALEAQLHPVCDNCGQNNGHLNGCGYAEIAIDDIETSIVNHLAVYGLQECNCKFHKSIAGGVEGLQAKVEQGAHVVLALKLGDAEKTIASMLKRQLNLTSALGALSEFVRACSGLDDPKIASAIFVAESILDINREQPRAALPETKEQK